MNKIADFLTLVEDAFKTPYKAFAFGLICSAIITYYVFNYQIDTLSKENEQLKKDIVQTKQDCLENIRVINNFLIEVSK